MDLYLCYICRHNCLIFMLRMYILTKCFHLNYRRDVLDQDKREVRLLQELLFEDGDLGDGHRQRKFRWRNAGVY